MALRARKVSGAFEKRAPGEERRPDRERRKSNLTLFLESTIAGAIVRTEGQYKPE